MNKSIYTFFQSLRTYQQVASSSPPQYRRAWMRLCVTLSFLGVLLLPPMHAQTGAALHFDGSNDHVAFSNTGLSASAGTIEMWVKESVVKSGTQVLIDLSSEQFVLYSEGTQLLAKIGTTTALVTTFTPTQWNHIAVTWTGNGTSFRLYLNGTQVGTGMQGASTISSSTGYLGRSANFSGYYLDATMDEVRIWTRALPQCEIQNNRGCELGSGQTGLSAYYKFNQGTVNTNNAGVTSLTDASRYNPVQLH